jgi:UDP-N-acetylmuramoylalanine--D-glutamate ligase
VNGRIAVFGLARSGLSIAKAALDLGADVTVVEERPAGDEKKQALARDLQTLGAKVDLGWSGDFNSGFDLVVTSPGVPMRHPKLESAHASGVPIHSEVEFAFRISKAPIVAITGTNGKSTTTALTYECLRGAGFEAVLCGNIYGSGYDEVPLTDAAHASRSDQVLVAEVSSFQLEWVSAFRPLASAITNIRPDHQDRYAGFEEYAATKRRIYAGQAAQDFAVLGADEPRPPYPQVLRFGPSGEGAVSGETLEVLGRPFLRSEFAIVGEHNFQNAAVALLLTACVAHRLRGDSLAVPPAAIPPAKAFKGIAHRMEAVGEKRGIRIINNSMCTNPDAVIASSRSVAAHQHLLLGGSNKKLDFAPLKHYLESSGHEVYLFGRDAEALKQQLGTEGSVFEKLAEAFSHAIRNAKPGDVVMLAPGCASMDQFEDFRDRGNVFRAMAKEWLES